MNQNFPLALSYDDVLLVPQYSEIESRSEIDLSTKISKKLTLQIPLIATKMDTVTGIKMAIKMSKLGGMAILPRFEPIEDQSLKVKKVKENGGIVAAAIGIKDDMLPRAEALVKAGVDALNIDVAHGHMKRAINATKLIKSTYSHITLISGIASTYDSAKDLYKAGADSLLVGVGAGSICTTRIVTGHGVPGLASLFEVAKAAKKYKKTFMPDAGIRNSGDIVKALASGASAIVGGFIFAGTNEAPGKIISINGQKYKKYSGSSSLEQKLKQTKKISINNKQAYINQVEGVEGLVPYKGSLDVVVNNLIAGIRSGLSYSGAKNIKELQLKAKFIAITPGGIKENGAHDIILPDKPL